MEINSNETSIVEQWEFVNNKMTTNEQGKRMDLLIMGYLKKVAADASGWYILYQDPKDKRYWELSFPKSEMQGGGPRLLSVLSEKEAMDKYTI
jgi:hypothetical protein